MNVAFFLTPKSEVITLEKKYTVGQALEVMKQHKYTSLPVLDEKGRYVDTLSEGDILWHLKDHCNYSIEIIEQQSLRKIKRHYNINAISIGSSIDSIIDMASTQAYVPVVDDQNIFIGIIKRSDIIHYCMTRINNKEATMIS
ncbi:CBS domain-containing protein [Petrocella sp. FN5]|uniref:CBS domain-containing protein n=1 Tax=Petrocella sp. FN5 TaxID=3032002 RepID=UPI0023DC5E91|nr:CBS domain-containing protein [Petrocella sp. FN5]MDF1617574.1 CBS domain-containing protein [Petrocella sp. FN5]